MSSAQRKPLDEACNGGLFCEVAGHVTAKPSRGGGTWFGHITLTAGQKATLRERRAAQRERKETPGV